MSLDCTNYEDNAKCPKKRQSVKKFIKSPYYPLTSLSFIGPLQLS